MDRPSWAVLDPETFEVTHSSTDWYPGYVGWVVTRERGVQSPHLKSRISLDVIVCLYTSRKSPNGFRLSGGFFLKLDTHNSLYVELYQAGHYREVV